MLETSNRYLPERISLHLFIDSISFIWMFIKPYFFKQIQEFFHSRQVKISAHWFQSLSLLLHLNLIFLIQFQALNFLAGKQWIDYVFAERWRPTQIIWINLVRHLGKLCAVYIKCVNLCWFAVCVFVWKHVSIKLKEYQCWRVLVYHFM